MSDLYRLTVTPSSPSYIGALLSTHRLVEDGVLVKVEPCSHGNYARHIVQYHRPPTQWCDGKPEADDG